MAAVALGAVGVHKRFGSVAAVTDVSIDILPGEVHALIGENGAGKSTLVKMLSGVYPPDSGHIVVGGAPTVLRSPHAGLEAGVSTIFQELTLVPDMTVAENIVLGREPTRGGLVRDRRARERAARDVLETLGSPEISPRRTVRTLGVAHQQVVEIAKAVSRPGVRALILDEPTAALTGAEVEHLFTVIAGLRRRGLGMLYITHRLAELDVVADRVTVMRDGAVVWTRPQAEVSTDHLVEAMVGRQVEDFFPPRDSAIGQMALELRDVRVTSDAPPVSLGVRRGEIVGLFGLMGAGRTELVRTVVGADPRYSGEVLVGGRPFHARSPREGLRRGVGLLPEDRKQQGIVPEMSVANNIALSSLGAVSSGPVVRRGRVMALASRMVSSMRIRLASPHQAIGSLSGGNQQKCLIGRLLAAEPEVLILDEPTRGVDVGARAEVYGIINALCAEGLGVLMVTSDMPEALGMCDRIVVLHEGRVAGELPRARADDRSVLALALGTAGGQGPPT